MRMVSAEYFSTIYISPSDNHTHFIYCLNQHPRHVWLPQLLAHAGCKGVAAHSSMAGADQGPCLVGRRRATVTAHELTSVAWMWVELYIGAKAGTMSVVCGLQEQVAPPMGGLVL